MGIRLPNIAQCRFSMSCDENDKNVIPSFLKRRVQGLGNEKQQKDNNHKITKIVYEKFDFVFSYFI